MNERKTEIYTNFTTLCVAVAITLLPELVKADGPARPNVLVILADDMGYADTGVTGCKDIPTPLHPTPSRPELVSLPFLQCGP